eukprot:CAMPEP_0201704748 /NCGR_PEP_ID=MMETSP0578-20130828/43771_1 /ASSEMBLY_ACC=CAM_ASM_000663 /TAXON_ID=267565 /ORGANISM="Skeletonema grethea, Strain CCMP 1804" /LENGTH=260 /DNA_ID=CAMNT_0048192841 /DNA_START=1678 /DNA_END=2460 /DNA_ORIENTATION=+
MEDATENETPFSRALKGDSRSRKGSSSYFRRGGCSDNDDCPDRFFRCNSKNTCVLKNSYKNNRFFGRCDKSSDCVDDEFFRCNRNRNRCVVRPEYRDDVPTSERCNTDVKVAVVATDKGKERKCAKKLRSDNSITRYLDRSLDTRKMRDYGVVRVDDCSNTQKMTNRMRDLESHRNSTNRYAKLVVAVVEKKNLSRACERALKKLSRDIEEDVRCRKIRRMRDRDNDSDASDIIVIEVKNESQCTRTRLKRKVLQATGLD